MNEGWFALFGAAIGFGGSIIRDVINNRSKIKLERIRIHDKEKLDSYKKLLIFARSVANTCYPLADDKLSRFISIMKGRFEQEIKTCYLYYSPQILEILDKFDEMYFNSMNRGDLTVEEADELDQFINKGLCEEALKIKELIKKEISLL